jgi:prepilin-type N-terminal cleavage/methylation domain-containing protein
MRARGRQEAGFSLIELLITMAVIAIIAGIAMINLLGALNRAKQRSTMADMRTIAVGVEIYHIDKGFLPVASSMTQLRSCSSPIRPAWCPRGGSLGHFFSYSQDGTILHDRVVRPGRSGRSGK